MEAIMIRTWLLSLAVAATLGLAGVAEARVSIMPMPRPPGEWVWVPPTYRTELIRVWVADRVERVPESYWVSATYGWRTIICYDEYGRRIERREWGEITPAHMETRYREVVVAGHYENQERSVLVSSGYWKYIGPMVDPPPVIIRPPIRPVDPVIIPPGGTGDPKWEEDKGKFSPLYEWPK
jgi:hypothetical protein